MLIQNLNIQSGAVPSTFDRSNDIKNYLREEKHIYSSFLPKGSKKNICIPRKEFGTAPRRYLFDPYFWYPAKQFHCSAAWRESSVVRGLNNFEWVTSWMYTQKNIMKATIFYLWRARGNAFTLFQTPDILGLRLEPSFLPSINNVAPLNSNMNNIQHKRSHLRLLLARSACAYSKMTMMLWLQWVPARQRFATLS